MCRPLTTATWRLRFWPRSRDLIDLLDAPVLSSLEWHEGIVDSVRMAEESLARLQPRGPRFVSPALDALESRFAALRKAAADIPATPADWFDWATRLHQEAARLPELLQGVQKSLGLRTAEFSTKLDLLNAHVDGIYRDAEMFLPWLKSFSEKEHPTEALISALGDGVGLNQLCRLQERLAPQLEFRRDANDDQIPFGSGPIDSNDLRRKYGPAVNDQRHRLSLSGTFDLGARFQLSGLWTMASGVPMDILMPSGQVRIPTIQRNAGGRQFESAGELNAFIRDTNAGGGIAGEPLPLVSESARFSDTFNSLDIRLSRPFLFGRIRFDPLVEVFNLFNVTNILGTTPLNYSGFANALVRDSNDPASPGYLTSSAFGTPIRTAGGVFGSGGLFALQFGARVSF